MTAPKNLNAPGRQLWKYVTDAFELGDNELALLEEACRTCDRIGQLRAQVDTDGLMIPSSQGMRLHPGVAEERAQRLALARLLATLGVPGLDDEESLPARSVRGVYGRPRR